MYADGLGDSFNGPKDFSLNKLTMEALKRLRGELTGKTYTIILKEQKSQEKWHCHVHFNKESGPRYGCAAVTPEDAMNSLAQKIHQEN